ncbi:hypothetical protein QCA50_011404 [Cerrena zonata]|uniref:Protein kinase domain-containing protein n=1 Tax=Cerrena zonata TaxID=2478898 RepID=A0AAW0FZJ3_9APHY
MPLYGMAKGSHSPALVLPWFERGHIRHYLQRIGNKTDVSQRITWIPEIASGLTYLHEEGILHGRLRRERVLVSDEGVAQLTDVTIIPFQEQRASEIIPWKDTGERWVAPEVSLGAQETLSSDVFSFALLGIEIFTAEVPFPDLHSFIVSAYVTQGVQPNRPISMPDKVWELMKQCWNLDPQQRPSMSHIVHALHECTTL